MTDIEIAQSIEPIEISSVAGCVLSFKNEDMSLYGKYKAKVKYDAYGDKNGKLILVTAINPTPLGEGKTTMSIGLADGLHCIGEDAVLCLREPSLGPVFGVKGRATGGGYAQVIPMEDINLHFTGDLHAIECANNLLAAMIDNHIFHGNELGIHTVVWKRCMDMNDRQLRNIICGHGPKANGVIREDGFDITVASEVMAIFCLASSLEDLKNRLGNIIIGYNKANEPIYARDLNAHGAMTTLLKDAFNPNLVQTLEATPAFIHGGPFANIAHGCNSLVATKLALSKADWVIAEAGFGADLGAEKFLDIKCRMNGLTPSAIVLVATVRALKYNGGEEKSLSEGIVNLERHISNLRSYGVPVVVCINKFPEDTADELLYIKDFCKVLGVECAISTAHVDGGKGSLTLARIVTNISIKDSKLSFPYELEDSLEEKIKQLAKTIYRAKDVNISKAILKKLKSFEDLGFKNVPICIAKTQYSFSDNPALLGAPKDFTMNVSDVRLSAGANFIVVICGNIMTMPGLPKEPAAEKIDITKEGKITGLF